MKVQRVVAQSLGSPTNQLLAMRFDEALCRSSLQLFDLKTIPAIRNGIPPEVTGVRFRSNLSRTPVLSRNDYDAASVSMRRLLPARLFASDH
jgi:hypothetical protein